ncbi:uncharacterized protein YALI1_A15017t [Yarrowia lipolytica]|uniref:Uncharacterized protein n=1 Tax=Yarrowia lipolytica TaxID=4952 RepID=A0A1D8N4X7_YARLL|nr:hypothetical protein YALI1_A15017t [Yarrowia lipolytica]
MCYADTVDEFEKLYTDFELTYKQEGMDRADRNDRSINGKRNSAYYYLQRHWFGNDQHPELRHSIVAAYTRESDFFETTTSSRIESIHSLQKSNMKTRIISLFQSATAVLRTSVNVLCDLEHAHAREMERYRKDINKRFCKSVRSFISTKALLRCIEQISVASHDDYVPSACTGNYSRGSGLPCYHMIGDLILSEDGRERMRPRAELGDKDLGTAEIHTRRAMLMLGDFDPRWRYLHTTTQMSESEWDEACNYGKFRERWEALRRSEKAWKKRDEELAKEVHAHVPRNGDLVAHMIEGEVVGPRRKRVGSLQASKKRKAGPECQVCVNQRHVTSERCFRDKGGGKAYREWKNGLIPRRQFTGHVVGGPKRIRLCRHSRTMMTATIAEDQDREYAAG